MPIRILLADDHAMVRDGVRALLEKQPDMAVVAEAADGREAAQLAEEHRPDVVVMDIGMPNLNGIDATRRILAAHPHTAVVILSMHQDESYVLRSLKAGAKAVSYTHLDVYKRQPLKNRRKNGANARPRRPRLHRLWWPARP